MKSNKNLGIWMDYSSAHLIDTDSGKNQIIRSKLTKDIKQEALKKGEKHFLHKEKQARETYFEEIADKILDYDQVLLFGPTHAKLELNHYLNGEPRFRHVKVTLESTDKMTKNEKNAFVKMHFND
jgi:hypothetical protein